MGKQFHVFAVEGDYPPFERVFSEEGFDVLLPYRQPSAALASIDSLASGAAMGFRVYIARRQDVALFPPLRSLPDGAFGLPEMEAQVVVFDRPIRMGTKLRRGRFYAATQRFDNGRWHSSDPEFVGAVERVFRRLKRMMVRDREMDAYVASQAQNMRASGDLQFVI